MLETKNDTTPRKYVTNTLTSLASTVCILMVKVHLSGVTEYNLETSSTAAG